MTDVAADPTAALPRRRSSAGGVVLFLVVCVLGLGADLVTKYLAFDRPGTRLLAGVVREGERWEAVGTEGRRVVVVPRLLELHATVNEGAVFGLGQGQRVWFVIVSVGAIAFLIYLVTKTRSRFEIVLLGCLLAGVLGNMYDRVRYGYVRDMILGLPGVSWPGAWQIPFARYPGATERLVFPYIFNVADSLLVCGVALLLIRSFVVGEKTKAVTDDTDGPR